MATGYVVIKFLHIFVAIVALGTSAGLGIVLEFYGNHAAHGTFVLTLAERMIMFVVVPGYVLMLMTGLWMVHLSWPITATWIQGALGLWVTGLLALGWSWASLRRQRKIAQVDGAESPTYRRASVLSRVLGGIFAFLVVGILYLMVFKP